MSKREKWEDDGRTVADMSGVGGPSLFLPRALKKQTGPDAEKAQSPQEPLLQGDERRWAILGAVKAALMIGFVFAAGLGLVILLMVLIWT